MRSSSRTKFRSHNLSISLICIQKESFPYACTAIMAPLLMSLPDEIKLRILGYVEIDIGNTHQSLRQTHPWFRGNISLLQLRELLRATEKSPRTIPANYLVCYTCVKILPKDRFADSASLRERRSLGVARGDRFCVACGIKHALYSPGSSLSVNGKRFTVCKECRSRFPTRDHLADKQRCRTSSDVQRFSQNRYLCRECGD